ncbi:ATP-binding protein [Rhizobium yanglingense]
MFTCMRVGSIRRQIAALAIGPIIALVLIGTIAEYLLADDFESVSYAKTTALKIEMVIDQLRASGSREEENVVLDVVSRTGLRVEEVSPAELSQPGGPEPPIDDVRDMIRKNLPESIVTSYRDATAGGQLREVLVVDIGGGRAMAFQPSPPPPDTWINDYQVSIVLQLMGLVLPVILLSLYAASMITAPLMKFSQAAEKLRPDDGPDRPFDERGAAEIRTLAKSLNDMRSRVREMIDDRTRMLRAISHDLRTPLTRLRLRVERSNQPELKAAILRDIAILGGMINDVLSHLSKEMASEKIVNADLPSLLGMVCSDFADVGFQVTYAGAERFAYRCRPQSLARAVANLVENSTKFAQSVTVELMVLENGTVRISVVDDGPGVPANLRSRVLDPFFKIDQARAPNERSGFGLGLSIVNDIVRAHGGTLELSNRLPRGLVARIDLPADADTPVAPAADIPMQLAPIR